MENKRINLLFNLVVIFFLALTFILIRELNANRAIDYKEYAVSITHIVKQKNDKIRALYAALVAQQKENAYLRGTLADTKSGLNTLSKKIGS